MGRRLSPVVEDYLKSVWVMTEWSDEPVTVSRLAVQLEVSPGTASESVRRLLRLNLVDHEPYGAGTLTSIGQRRALDVVRRHRLLETFLVRELGYAWDDVHEEAEVLEHAVSDLLIARIDDRLGHPRHDPTAIPSQTPTVTYLK